MKKMKNPSTWGTFLAGDVVPKAMVDSPEAMTFYNVMDYTPNALLLIIILILVIIIIIIISISITITQNAQRFTAKIIVMNGCPEFKDCTAVL